MIKQISPRRYKVCKKEDPTRCFSNKGLTKQQAIKQMSALGRFPAMRRESAIIINEHKRKNNK